MKIADVLRRRVARHFLGPERGPDVVAVARRLGGLHAQVAASAQAAADLRLAPAPDLERALYRDRTLVRTWAARGTLHLLPAVLKPLAFRGLLCSGRPAGATW
jgi:hypothetical protein